MPHRRLPLLPLILDHVPPGLRQALGQEGIPCRDPRPGQVEGRFLLFDGRRIRPTPQPGQVLLDVDSLRADWPYDPFESLIDTHAEPLRWQIGRFCVTERVARFDKCHIRQKLLQSLRDALEKAGGIWLRVAAFPFPYRSAFNFRIDHDAYNAAHFDATLQAIAGSEEATSHFVNASAFASAGDALDRLRGLDVGSHGYWHHIYRTTEENRRNIARGIDVLRRAGLDPSGFAAPHGRFNDALLTVLTELSVTHSSDFSLAYDDLPALVGTSDLLQIPVHPICLGLFLEAADRQRDAAGQLSPAEAVQTVIEHFELFARTRHELAEPIFLYGHPDGRLGRYPEVLRHVLATVAGFDALWKTNFSRVNAWWRARAQLRLSAQHTDDHVLVTADRLAPPYRVAVEYYRGQQVAVIPLDEPTIRFAPDSLIYETRTAAPTARPVRIDRSEGLRGRIRRLIDWERVTPVNEIPTNTWRNLTKRALRELLKP